MPSIETYNSAADSSKGQKKNVTGVDLGGDHRALEVISYTPLIKGEWDYASLVQASLTDTWTFKSGGSGGTTVNTVTITYTSSAKTTISTVERT